MSLMYKLQSSDGVIHAIDEKTVKQMATLYTMVQSLGESEEIIPVPTVNSFLLKKSIHWTKIFSESDYQKYFNVDLRTLLELILAADYLELTSLVNEACFNVLMKSKPEETENAAIDLDQKVLGLLEEYREDYGYDVIVTVQQAWQRKLLQFYDPKVSWT